MSKIVGIDLGTTSLFAGRFFLGKEFNSHNVGNDGQSSSNYKQGRTDRGTINNVTKLFRSHFENLSKIIATSKDTIANVTARVNVAGSILIKPGAIRTNANQPADKLPKIPDRTLKNDFVMMDTLTKIQIGYN